jgi:hypothetical protein
MSMVSPTETNRFWVVVQDCLITFHNQTQSEASQNIIVLMRGFRLTISILSSTT